MLQSGDQLSNIATNFDMSEVRLRRINSLKRGQILEAGDPIFIEPKRRKWSGNIHSHTILKGETLHSVAQLYGIRESSLVKLNDLGDDPVITEGWFKITDSLRGCRTAVSEV